MTHPLRLSTAIVSLLSLIALACSSSTGPDGPPEFPNSTGNAWTYAVHDTIDGSARVDTALVRIVLRTYTIAAGEPPDTALQSRPAMVWEILFRGDIDSLLVLRHPSSVELNPMEADGMTLFRRIRFPLVVGAEWDGGLGHEIVTAQEAVVVPAGTFDGTFRIDAAGAGRRYWFKPQVGLIAFEAVRSGAGEAVVQRWELIRYELH